MDRPIGRAGERPTLTLHERAVLELVALGLSDRAIGERLWITRKGVAYHVSNLLAKFEIATRTGLVARAYTAGFLVPGRWPPEIAGGPGASDAPGRG